MIDALFRLNASRVNLARAQGRLEDTVTRQVLSTNFCHYRPVSLSPH